MKNGHLCYSLYKRIVKKISNWNHPFSSRNTFLFHLLLVIIISITLTEGNPVKGMVNCYNNQDCVGANRLCHRNTTMKDGVCTCRSGYRQAIGERIKCLNIVKRECHSNLDCESLLPCLPTVGTRKEWSHEVLTTYYKHYRRPQGPKYCMGSHLTYPGLKHSGGTLTGMDPSLGGQIFRNGIDPPRTGGGLLPGGHEHDYNTNKYIRVSGNNYKVEGLNPEYIKFVEDCMLVLFLLCVLITLLVVHRASCARQFRRARRDGPLRYIIPHRDDQPPPYANYAIPEGTMGTRADTANVGEILPVTGEMMDDTDGVISSHSRNPINMANHVQSVLGVSRKSAETPPPTYDEALAISQALSASMIANDTFPSLQMSNTNLNPSNPNFHQRNLYINLPSPSSILVPTNTNELRSSGDTTISQDTTNNDSSLMGNQGRCNDDNPSSVLQRQQSYQPAQGSHISTSSELVSNPTNEII